ncbi:DNA topoisomerase II [Zalerion maritima]|uniref:DNA topoisomerase 2 n=1 Tax=Zalerion maritima TaxID=339359 RepID=A0AAD5RY98_9PEZI|nr:DNA topoisomerase II [Zalerion maritima]
MLPSMDLSDLEDSRFNFGSDSDALDAFELEIKPKAKKPAAKATKAKTTAAKKAQSTLSFAKKRSKPNSDDNDDMTDGDFSHTPPSAKKQKKAPVKKPSGKPLAEIENDTSMTMDGAPPITKGKKGKSTSEQYEMLSHLEHIKRRPDTYIGSVEMDKQRMWVFNKETQQMDLRDVSFVPGLYKIFDEILVNAADNKQRCNNMTYIKVTINREDGKISIENNGKGIPVEMHKKHDMYIPQMIFGNLLTGSNYDDAEKKTVGGRNGYGAKLCNVFSTEFVLECQDSANCKSYKQVWTNNMDSCGKPKINSNKKADFVRVTFKPDFKRFSMDDGIDEDLEALMIRRVYDMAGTIRGLKVYLNGDQIKISSFARYCDMYARAVAKERGGDMAEQKPNTVIMDDSDGHPRWEVGFAISDGNFQQVSFVNNIATTSGGSHVNDVADQMTKSLLKRLSKAKKGHNVKQNQLKNHIFVFLNCLIENPAFTSQTKEQLTTKPSQFGSRCSLTDKFLKKIEKTDVIEDILAFAEKKADRMLAKSDGSKRSRISNAKLVDANLAGTRNGHECTLILTEGDSAKSLAVAGRAILDPDRIGVFPLRGKLLNVRDASMDQLSKNAEINNIKQFLGLKHKQHYTDTKSLRYGHLMVMADQDHDGSHIKGLLINFLQVQFPSLLQIPDFFREFITPIVKVWQGPLKRPTRLRSFFTQPQYEQWRERNNSELSKWHFRYYKGLGTSSNEDAQVYFTNLDDHLKEFNTMKPNEAELFELAFSKKKADARKEWLGNFVPGTFLDHSTKSITYSDFINKELILFSMADNIRSIPSVLDGLKPGQRKVIYSCLKRNLTKEMKVIELTGYVSGETSYHHGDASLHQTIVGLAQNFVGSNNVNCLEPSGNFGSRLQGGSDAASARYIYTKLSPFARRVFSPLDEPNLDPQYEDGKKIEPKVYVPVIPMVLVNGADGIGTGWSTSIPNYHPIEIIQNIRRRMGRLDDDEEKPFEAMTPWFRGWKGNVEQTAPDRYQFSGIANNCDNAPNEVEITELPVRTWTDDFKAKLEDVIRGEKSPSWIKDYKEFNDHKNVHFIIQMEDKHVKAALDEGLLDRFKLKKSVATSNLVAFNVNGQIRKYEKVEDIMEEYYNHRLSMYKQRKAYWLGVYDGDWRKLSNQARFVKEIIDGKFVVSKKKKQVVVQQLRDKKYEPFPKNIDKKKQKSEEEEEQENEEEEDGVDANTVVGTRDYDYLLSMPIWSFTYERLEKLKKQIENKRAEYDELEMKSEKDLWCEDLEAFEQEWETQLVMDEEIQKDIRKRGRTSMSKKIGAGRGRGRTAKAADDEYNPTKKRGAKTKTADVPKVETKAADRFSQTYNAAKSKPKAPAKKSFTFDDDDFSEDDFLALGGNKTSAPVKPKIEDDSEPSVSASQVRSKRAAAAAPKRWVVSDEDDSDANMDKMLGDVGGLVKGIDKPSSSSERTSKSRVSLFAMERPVSSHGSGDQSILPSNKVKAKPSKTFDFDSNDDTNYEMLAKSSPHKSAISSNRPDDFDSSVSDDDFPPVTKTTSKSSTTSAPKPAAAPAAQPAAKKTRGRSASAKTNAKEKAPVAKKAAPKKKERAQTTLSPAAKAYAAKKAKAKKHVFSDDDDEDDDLVMRDAEPESPAPRPAGRGRPARTVAATKKKPVYVDSDEEDEVMAFDDDGADGGDSDVFAIDDSD